MTVDTDTTGSPTFRTEISGELAIEFQFCKCPECECPNPTDNADACYGCRAGHHEAEEG